MSDGTATATVKEIVTGIVVEVGTWKLKLHPVISKSVPEQTGEARDRLKVSIQKHGFYKDKPIIANLKGEIIAGRTRWEIAKELQLQTVPVVYLDFATAASEIVRAVHDEAIRRHLGTTDWVALVEALTGKKVVKGQPGRLPKPASRAAKKSGRSDPNTQSEREAAEAAAEATGENPEATRSRMRRARKKVEAAKRPKNQARQEVDAINQTVRAVADALKRVVAMMDWDPEALKYIRQTLTERFQQYGPDYTIAYLKILDACGVTSPSPWRRWSNVVELIRPVREPGE